MRARRLVPEGVPGRRPRPEWLLAGALFAGAAGLAFLDLGETRAADPAEDAGQAEPPAQDPPTHADAFRTTIRPFLQQHCVRCHGQDVQKAKFALHDARDRFESKQDVDGWVSVLDMLTFGDMPPADEKQPDPQDTAKVVEWIKHRLEETGKAQAYQAKLLAPEYGNYVSHEELFSGEIKTPPYSPARLWRFSSNIFEARGFRNARSPFTFVTPKSEIRDYAAMSGVDRSTVQMILINTEQWLEHREQNGEFKDFTEGKPAPAEQAMRDRIRREFRTVIRRDATDEEADKYLAFLKENIALGGNRDGLKTTITAMFLGPEAIYRMEFGLGAEDEHGRRHLSPEETAYALAYALTDRGPDHLPAIRDAFKQGKLNNREDVARVVQQVLDEKIGEGTPSDQPLPRIMRFFEEYFGFHRAGDVFKDNDRRRLEDMRQWNTNMLVHDARSLILHRLREDEDVIARLLTGNEFFVAHPGDNDYAKAVYEKTLAEVLAPGYVEAQVTKRWEQLEKRDKPFDADHVQRLVDQERKRAEDKVRRFKQAVEDGIKPFPGYPFARHRRGIADLIYITPYNLPGNARNELQRWAWEYEQPIELPAAQRAGILTHPAWLAAHSWNDGNDPIHRGIWVQEKLLAGVIHDVPPDVDARVPIDPHKTLRERMQILRAERCWNCHRKINPLGEPFEMFDDWGRFRTHDYFDKDGLLVTRRDRMLDNMLEKGQLTQRPIDATGAIAGSGDPSVDGPVENAIDMMNRLGRSNRARQTFIRYLFRYFMGRNERLSDSQTLIAAEQAYLESNGSFKALVVSLLSSDSFLYRR